MNQQIEDIFGYKHIITKEIARGGQGAVFRTQNPNLAIKMEIDSVRAEFSKDTSQNKALNDLRLLPVPSRINLTLPKATLKDYAGYVMPLLDDMQSFEDAFDYKPSNTFTCENKWLEQYEDTMPDFVDMFSQYIISGGRRRRLDAYFRVACILSGLHANGLVYCDFSAKNAFISSVVGNNTVWVIDADNLNYQNVTRHISLYTPGYGAPEVINGRGCTFYSDSYAFAVSLFWQLTGHHPFKGPLTAEDDFDDFTDDTYEKAYSGEYPWICDNVDIRNNLDVQQNFYISQNLMRCFNRTFSECGRHNRIKRTSMFEWSNALGKELDHSIRCSKCHMDYDASYLSCPWCDNSDKRIIMTSELRGREIWSFTHEINVDEIFDVPLRILNGVMVEQCEKRAFTLCYNGHNLLINNLDDSPNVEWSVLNDSNDKFVDIYGTASISTKCVLKRSNKEEYEDIKIKVEMI